MQQIVFVNRFYAPDESATSQMLTDLAAGLAALGRPVTVVTSRQRLEDPKAELPPIEILQGVRVVRVRTTQFGRVHLAGRALDYLSFYVAASWALLRLLKRGDLAIAKTDPPMFSVPARLCCAIRGAHLINWLQDVFPEVALRLNAAGPLRRAQRVLLALRNGSLRASRLNVVIGARMRQHLIAEGVPSEQIAVIPNWADIASIQPVERDRNPLRSDWRLGDALVIGYSGNLGRAHRFDAILAAARHFRANPGIKFLFIGGGAGMSALRKAADAEGLGNIVFKPYQPREALALSLSVPDVHLVSLEPALEGLIVPSKFYGIAAAGRATIYLGSHNGDIAEHLERTGAGITIEPGDHQSLQQFLDSLLRSNGETIREMGHKARQLATSEFCKERAVEHWHRRLSVVTDRHAAMTTEVPTR